MADTAIINEADEFVTAGFTGSPEELIPLLQYYQNTYGYISPPGAEKIACFLGISAAKVFTVASFFAQFRFKKPGENHICVCLGTACHVQGGDELSQEVQEHLHIQSGDTTPDGRFDFEEVACLGCCAQAAVVEVNGKIYAKMSRDKLRNVLEQYDRA
ncbi:MAG: NAD(P)H-dependent oxidoreductase subunit E [Chloroflexi bacterium]|nr:NAD(P)H-dependent oxidoreductase subunit E [Chloroflexota bacterium]